MREIPDEIREAIRRSGKSLRAVARASGVNVGAISRLMARKQGLTLESAKKLGGALGFRLRLVRKRRLGLRAGNHPAPARKGSDR